MTEPLPRWVTEDVADACPVCGRPVEECVSDLRQQFLKYGERFQARIRSER